jgi:ceramide glucosyltransferase
MELTPSTGGFYVAMTFGQVGRGLVFSDGTPSGSPLVADLAADTSLSTTRDTKLIPPSLSYGCAMRVHGEPVTRVRQRVRFTRSSRRCCAPLSVSTRAAATVRLMIAKLVIVTLGVGMVTLLFALVTHACVVRTRRRLRFAPGEFPISVLKPLKGVGEGLYENLVSFALQDHPCFELVLGCEDGADPALAVARRLAVDFPEVAITVVAGCRSIGLNPKVNNLRALAERARFEHLLVSDADVRVGPEYLRALAAEMASPGVGLVSNVIAGTGEQSLGSALESLHLNTFVARSVCGADVLAGHPCVIGKSMLFRRGDLESLGGFAVVKDVLAEDYVLGRLFRDAGHRVALCPYVVTTRNPSRSVRDFVSRHVRWGQMRRHLAPRLYWGEPLMLPAVWLLAALGGLRFVSPLAVPWARSAATAAGIALVTQVVSDAVLVRQLRGSRLPWKDLVLVPLRDVVALGIWLVAALRLTVSWRGNHFVIGPGSVLSPDETRAAGERVPARS